MSEMCCVYIKLDLIVGIFVQVSPALLNIPLCCGNAVEAEGDCCISGRDVMGDGIKWLNIFDQQT
jgi:hypothetical protein